MYGLSGWFWFMVNTDNTAYQALVLVWLWCGNLDVLNSDVYVFCMLYRNSSMSMLLFAMYNCDLPPACSIILKGLITYFQFLFSNEKSQILRKLLTFSQNMDKFGYFLILLKIYNKRWFYPFYCKN